MWNDINFKHFKFYCSLVPLQKLLDIMETDNKSIHLICFNKSPPISQSSQLFLIYTGGWIKNGEIFYQSQG